MKKYIIIAAVVLFVCSCAPKEVKFGETGKTFGWDKYDSARDIVKTDDGTFVLAGMTTSIGAGHVDAWIFNVDRRGKKRWSVAYGTAGDDRALCLAKGADSGYIAGGFTAEPGASAKKLMLLKTDNKGRLEWRKVYGGPGNDEALAVEAIPGRGYAVAGHSNSFGEDGKVDAWIIKTDIKGDILWDRTYGGGGQDVFESVLPADGGKILAAGRTSSFGVESFDAYAVMADAKGNCVWSRTYGGSGFDGVYAALPADEGFVFACVKGEPEKTRGGHIWLIGIDPEGNVVWEKVYEDANMERPVDIIHGNDGGFVIAGTSESMDGEITDIFIMKTDSAGNKIYKNYYGGRKEEYAGGVISVEGGYAAAGWSASYGEGEYSAWMFTIDENGKMR